MYYIMLLYIFIECFNLIAIIGTLSKACDLDQMQYGCRIYNAQCRCGYGCSSEYRYSTNDDCKEALRGNNLPAKFTKIYSIVHSIKCHYKICS